MKKTIYRVELREDAPSICETLITMAAKSNGGKTLSLEQLKGIGESHKILYTSLTGETNFEIVAETSLHVDTKVGGEWKTVCILEQVEIFELVREVPEESQMQEVIN